MPSSTPTPQNGFQPGSTDHMTVPDGAADPARLDPAIASALSRDAAGLVAAVVQQYDTLEVLMLGWMDEEALRRTLTTGRVTFWSRSRSEYWRKGDTSGHRQWVRGVALDCDGDALLVTVDQEGAACHTGTRTCFDGRELPAVTDATQATREERGAQQTQQTATRPDASGTTDAGGS